MVERHATDCIHRMTSDILRLPDCRFFSFLVGLIGLVDVLFGFDWPTERQYQATKSQGTVGGDISCARFPFWGVCYHASRRFNAPSGHPNGGHAGMNTMGLGLTTIVSRLSEVSRWLFPGHCASIQEKAVGEHEEHRQAYGVSTLSSAGQHDRRLDADS